jgi:filamentous hemagglutinin
MPDGSYTSVDNTRLAVAREMNIGVRVRVHGYDDPLPQGFSNPLDPRFPSPKTGEPASTWGEAVENRIGSQGSAFRGENPLGAQEIPRMR